MENIAISSIKILPSYSALNITYKAYKDSCQLAAFICNTPSSNVALLEVPKSPNASLEDANLARTRLEALLLDYICNNSQELFLVENSQKDPRFRENTEGKPVSLPVFIAIVPIRDCQKKVLGILYIEDNFPKKLTLEQCEALAIVASQTLPFIQATHVPKKTELHSLPKKIKKRISEKAIKKPVAALDSIISTPLHTGYTVTTVVDIKGNISCVSPSLCFALGYTSKELLGENIFNYVHPEDRNNAIHNFLQFVQEKPFISRSYRIKHKSGNWRWFEGLANDLIANTAVQGIAIKARDITEKMALKAAEEKFRLLFDHSPLPKYVYDIDSLKILDVNEAMISLYGYSREELLAMTIKDIRPLKELDKLMAGLQVKPQKESPFNYGIYTHQKKNGDLVLVEVTGRYLPYNNQNCLMVACKDVTEQIAAEEKIKKSNERFQIISQTTKDFIWDWDKINNTLYYSEAYKTLFGYKKHSGSGNSWHIHIHPEDEKTVKDSIEQAFNDPKCDTWEAEYRFKKANGEYAYVQDKGVIIRNKEGDAIRMVGVMSDITYCKNHENSLRKLNQELREYALSIEHQNKIFRDIAWTQSHVVRAPVARLMGIIDLFKNDMLDTGEKEEMLDHILAACQEIDLIINDIVEKSNSVIDMEKLSCPIKF
ncbi:PAS domain-containing protein [Arenibacter nanhaiticus]|uniref:PAS domain-containing protein n=1 Tax=Arenibacter nanhaiticus TaxID=558155 RepID=UPI0015B4ABFA|nr:PAS domain S-box protein [Arenibacter nanhaiticus]